MKKQIVITQIPMRVGVVQRLKKTTFIRLLAVIYHEMRFYLTFKKFNHGNEFNGYICKLPFEYAELTSTGEVGVCCYLPKNIGNIDRAPFKKVWNSFFSRQLRKSMLDGSFCYCDKTKCRSMQNFDSNLIKKEEVQDQRLKEIISKEGMNLDADLKTLSLANDYSCNLECPSCRVGMRKMAKEEVSHQIQNFNSIIETVGPKLELIHIAGDGDPFASQFYDYVIRQTKWEDYPNLKIGFQTNGVALTEKKWNSLPSEVKNKVIYIGISIDGASTDTYEKLRLGGKFERLISNIEYLARMPDKQKLGICLNLNMIVQAQNYREIIPLIVLGKKLGVDKVSFTYIRDWGTFPSGEYERQAIQMPIHPEHSNLLEILKDPILRDPAVDMGNLVHLMPENL
ncbi:SPASM domain-containing protein [Methylomonas methanica]|uniref:Radical SAM domain protein n=1 Tax=Methylomonas methanica (strain DSM 25384 / MC09) TaxID=857087 RepID=F9ZWD5_METMM|nr:SPASM domain-containing protein [Methylomonas methanica]AEF99604.1 radical SAM domain protein [Methylomonas methanica MC09]